jgi:hypothetical protein
MKRSFARRFAIMALVVVAGVVFSGPGAGAMSPPHGSIASTIPADPRDPSPRFSLRYPPQRVSIERSDVVARFAAWVRVRRDHRALGQVTLRLADGQPLRFAPVFGAVVPETETGPAYIVILMAGQGAPLQSKNFAIATVRPDPQLPGCDIWDFTSNVDTRRGASSFHIVFHAEGEIRFAHALRTALETD